MKQENKNFLYNIIYQIFVFAIPLVSTPYISRTLGVDNVGVYSYTYSIVSYFMMFSLLGINNYGARKIAKNNKNKKEMSSVFINIYLLQLILTMLMTALYFAFVFLIYPYNKTIMTIQAIYLVSVMFDINWLYFGLEKFKITISRNIIIKIITLISVFAFIKDSDDLWKYTLIVSCGTLISQIYLWLFLKKHIIITKPNFRTAIKTIKPCLVLFIPVLAYSIYRVMDKTMIGFFAGTVELGNYESAEKIINIPISIITALGTVMLPHMSKMNDKKNIATINDTFRLIFFIIVPICFGLLAISSDFSDIFFGEEYSLTGNIIKLLIPTVIFSAVSNVIRTAYLIPREKDGIYVVSTIIGAIINLILNLIFINKYGAYGACIGTIMAEFSVMFYQIIKTKTVIKYWTILQILIEYVIKSLIIIIPIIAIGLLIENIYIKLLLQVICSAIAYLIINRKYVLKDFLGIKK